MGFLRPSSHDSVIVRGLFSGAVVYSIDGKWMNLYIEHMAVDKGKYVVFRTEFSVWSSCYVTLNDLSTEDVLYVGLPS